MLQLEEPTDPKSKSDWSRPTPSKRTVAFVCAAIFVLAVGVRLLVWFNTAAEIDAPMSGLTASYEHEARKLLAGDVNGFVRGANPPSDASVLAHPPGYAMLMAAVLAARGSLTAMRVVQLILSSLAAVLVLLIAAQFLSWRAAWLAGVLVAVSPQLSYNSLLLLPDSLSVLPILLALLLLLSRGRAGDWTTMLMCGALLGLSLWFRANTVLLPLFIAVAAAAFWLPTGRRWRAVAIVGAALLVMAPMTIRNAVVFGRFVPVSLAAGVTMIEGIADYDPEGRFGLPRTDLGVTAMEAKEHGRPEYNGSLFNPDGIDRERERVSRASAIIRAHPFWFATVMARRASMMLRLERVSAISPDMPSTVREPLVLQVMGVVLYTVQRAFITALFLPLALVGLVLLLRRREHRLPAAMLLTVVFYLLAVQSLLHTEYRYVLIIQHISLLFAAAALAPLSEFLGQWRSYRLVEIRRKG